MPLLDILQEAVRREASDVLVIAGLPVSWWGSASCPTPRGP